MTSLPTETVILNTSPEAAKQVTVTGWMGRDGRWYGSGPEGERIARYAGCTHVECQDCKAPTTKGWTHCDSCRAKRRHERYLALPLVEWDGVTPLCTHDGDDYFFDLESIYEQCNDWETSAANLDLVVCEPAYLREIDTEYWQDDLPEDGDLPEPIASALAALNKAIRDYKQPISWWAGKKRVSIPHEDGNDE